MPIPPMPDLCQVHRPYGGPLLYANVVCRLIPRFWSGRGGFSGSSYQLWTHILDVLPAADIRDNIQRANGLNFLNYSDGDEVRLTLGTSAYKFVTVWVEHRYTNTPSHFKRCYLLRNSVTW